MNPLIFFASGVLGLTGSYYYLQQEAEVTKLRQINQAASRHVYELPRDLPILQTEYVLKQKEAHANFSSASGSKEILPLYVEVKGIISKHQQQQQSQNQQQAHQIDCQDENAAICKLFQDFQVITPQPLVLKGMPGPGTTASPTPAPPTTSSGGFFSSLSSFGSASSNSTTTSNNTTSPASSSSPALISLEADDDTQVVVLPVAPPAFPGMNEILAEAEEEEEEENEYEYDGNEDADNKQQQQRKWEGDFLSLNTATTKGFAFAYDQHGDLQQQQQQVSIPSESTVYVLGEFTRRVQPLPLHSGSARAGGGSTTAGQQPEWVLRRCDSALSSISLPLVISKDQSAREIFFQRLETIVNFNNKFVLVLCLASLAAGIWELWRPTIIAKQHTTQRSGITITEREYYYTINDNRSSNGGASASLLSNIQQAAAELGSVATGNSNSNNNYNKKKTEKRILVKEFTLKRANNEVAFVGGVDDVIQFLRANHFISRDDTALYDVVELPGEGMRVRFFKELPLLPDEEQEEVEATGQRRRQQLLLLRSFVPPLLVERATRLVAKSIGWLGFASSVVALAVHIAKGRHLIAAGAK